jgi:hypothetical protein
MTRWIGGALAGWLAVGLAGLAAYVYGYDAHRGFGATQTPAGVPRGQLRVIAFRSPAIHRTERYLVYLPPAYAREAARGERFPVLYFLHGAPGKMTSLTDVDAAQVTADELIARHRIRPLLLVAPAAVQGLYGAPSGRTARPGAGWTTWWPSSTTSTAASPPSPAAATAPSPATPRAPMARSTSRCTTWGCSASSRAGRATSGRRAAPCSRTRLPPRSPPTARRPRCGRSGARSAGSACAPGSTRAGRTAAIRRRRSTSPPICAGPAPRCGSASSPAATTGRCGGARRRGC